MAYNLAQSLHVYYRTFALSEFKKSYNKIWSDSLAPFRKFQLIISDVKNDYKRGKNDYKRDYKLVLLFLKLKINPHFMTEPKRD